MKKKMSIFLLGSLCFVISQILLRMPILNYIQRKAGFTMFYTFNPLLTGILIAFSAGLFEEGFRFTFKKYLLKSSQTKIKEPIIFGLGHGIIEALIILGPFLLTVPLEELTLGIVERILAIILHIGLSVIIWNGFMLNKKYTYLGIGILVHGLVNSLIPLLSHMKNGIILIETLFLIIDIFIVIYIYRSRKYYYKEEKLNE